MTNARIQTLAVVFVLNQQLCLLTKIPILSFYHKVNNVSKLHILSHYHISKFKENFVRRRNFCTAFQFTFVLLGPLNG